MYFIQNLILPFGKYSNILIFQSVKLTYELLIVSRQQQ